MRASRRTGGGIASRRSPSGSAAWAAGNIRCPEARLDLAQALDQLSAEQRAAVALHYYQDLSVEETAKALKVPVDTMKSRLKTALRRLRDLTGSEEISA